MFLFSPFELEKGEIIICESKKRMSLSLAHRFILVPMKRTIPPTVNQKSTHTIPQKEVDELAVLRNALLADFDRIHNCGGDTTAALPTEQARADFVTDLLAKLDAYEMALQTAVNKCPSFGSSIYFFWQASMTERLNHAFDDYRFELSSLHFNTGAAMMNIGASVVLAAPTGQLQAAFDKEAYGYLLAAAGHFELAETLIAEREKQPIGTTQNALTEDSKPGFLSFLKLVALAQAQEIGVSKMIQTEANKGKEINAKLCRRAADLYREAESCLSKRVVTHSHPVDAVVFVITVKLHALDALTYSLFASTRVDADMPMALLLLATSQEKWNLGQHIKAPGGDAKKALPFGVAASVQAIGRILEHNAYRINQINSLVTRAKVSQDAPAALPAAQELARPRQITLPVPATSPPPAGATAIDAPKSVTTGSSSSPPADGWVDVGKN